MTRIRPTADRRALLALLAVLVAFWDVWRWWGDRILFGADAAYGLLAFGVALAAVLRAPRGLASRGDFRAAAAATVAYAVVRPFTPPSVAAFFALLAVLFAVLAVFGARLPAACPALCVLALPVVPQLDFFAGYPLRAAAAITAQAWLGLAGEFFDRTGAVLVRDGRVFAVDAPCSGVRMLWSALLLSAGLCAWRDLGPVRSFLIAAGTSAAVVLANGFRTAAILMPDWRGSPLSPAQHAAVGVVAFAALAAVVERVTRKGEPCAASAS